MEAVFCTPETGNGELAWICEWACVSGNLRMPQLWGWTCGSPGNWGTFLGTLHCMVSLSFTQHVAYLTTDIFQMSCFFLHSATLRTVLTGLIVLSHTPRRNPLGTDIRSTSIPRWFNVIALKWHGNHADSTSVPSGKSVHCLMPVCSNDKNRVGKVVEMTRSLKWPDHQMTLYDSFKFFTVDNL
jgi:hypothetical protein